MVTVVEDAVEQIASQRLHRKHCSKSLIPFADMRVAYRCRIHWTTSANFSVS